MTLVKKCRPETSRSVGPSFAEEEEVEAAREAGRSKDSARRGSMWRMSGYVDATHEALKSVATAPLATGTAVALLVSQV